MLVTDDGEVKLLDFGIAKLMERRARRPAPATTLTREGGRALTPEYAAPEQVPGEPITTATDVYALGVLLYVLLTGSIRPRDAVAVELIKAIVDTERRGSRARSSPTERRTRRRLAARRSTTPASCALVAAIWTPSSPRR